MRRQQTAGVFFDGDGCGGPFVPFVGHLGEPAAPCGCEGHFSQGKESGKHNKENKYPQGIRVATPLFLELVLF